MRKRPKIDVNKSGIQKLRQYISDMRLIEDEYRAKIFKLERTVYALREKMKEERVEAKAKIVALRHRRDVRINKLRWKIFKKNQQVWAIKNSIKERRLQKAKIRNKGYKAGMANANRTAKERWYVKGVERGKVIGVRIGVREGKKIKMPAVYQKGREAGKRAANKSINNTYNFRRRLIYRIESTTRMSMIIGRLSKALGLSYTIISYLLWCSQHEHWTKKDIDRAFDDIGFDNYYVVTSRCKRLGLVQSISSINQINTWALTYSGKELTSKMNAYVNRYFSKK